MPEKRNIVLITLDSLRADHCSFMGYHKKTTPTIDKMARNGLYFENAVTSGVGTPASMTCIFTGDCAPVNPTETNPEPWRKVLSHRETLAQVLSENGYSTGAIHPNPFVSRYFGFNKGFEHYEDFLTDEDNSFFTRVYRKIFEKTIESKRSGLAPVIRNIRNFIQREELFKPWESFYEQVYDWIKKSEEPFFLWILLLDTHYPFLAPRKYRRWSNLFDMWYHNWKMQKGRFNPKLSEKGRQKLKNAYDDSIYYADAFINKLWKDLEEEDPIFIIHGDHGEGFGEHGFYGHQSYLYEEVIHIPLVVYNANIRDKIEKPVSTLQLPTSLLELLELENEFPSKSFLNSPKDWAIVEIPEENKRKLAVRMKDWKFISGQKEENELYNLKKDPREETNLIEEHPDLAKEMENIIERHIKQKMEKEGFQKRVSGLRLK